MTVRAQDIERELQILKNMPIRPLTSHRQRMQNRLRQANNSIEAGASMNGFSLGAGNFLGGEGGFEQLQFMDGTIAVYGQVGGGVTSPGASWYIEVGYVWNVRRPSDYSGSFFEVSGGATTSFISGTIGVFGWPHPPGSSRNIFEEAAALINGSYEPVWGIKFGLGVSAVAGVSGAAFYEYYWEVPPGGNSPPRPGVGRDHATMRPRVRIRR